MTIYKTLLTAVLLVFASHALADKLRIGMEAAYPPFNFMDTHGKPVGFDVDIGYALCEKMQAECQVVISDWDGIIPALNAGKFDFIISSMSITEERSKAVDFSDPYYSNKLQFVGLKNQDFPIDEAAFKGKIIGAQRATISGIWLEENLKSVDIKLYDTQENAYLDLASGRLDGLLGDAFVHWEWLNSEIGKSYEFKGEPVFEDDKIGMAVRKKDPLRERLNKALAEIVADGTYQKINAKYFPFSIY